MATEKNVKKHRKLRIADEVSEDISSASEPYEGQVYDISLHAWLSKFGGSLSPAALAMVLLDWVMHLLIAPAKRYDLSTKAFESYMEYILWLFSLSGFNVYKGDIAHVEAGVKDPRFKEEGWKEFPFNIYSNTFLVWQDWWQQAVTNIRGVSCHHEHMMQFLTRQVLDFYSPSNSPFTNPEIISKAVETGGTNFVDGFNNLSEDLYRSYHKLPPLGAEKFKVGENLAITPGKVIFRNRIMELIQYSPTTEEVYAEPILIVPAWIMKYYILDLSPHNSLVKYLVDNGHTVFIISWKNPDSNDRNLGLDDYLHYGIMNALDTISKIIPHKKINTVGYCLGGTLLSIAAAVMGAMEDHRIQTTTLFAAQVDFRDAGEITLFIDQSQITYLEDIMWEKGYLDGSKMAGAFNLLRSNDLIWSRVIHDYLLGQRRPMNDLMAWNTDTTRLPMRMHSQYLHNLFLNNDLTQGHFKVGKDRVVLGNIKTPIFAVATAQDHVSPWKSVYKMQLFTNTPFTFVLTNGGHNAGIVSEPGHKNRYYQMDTRKKSDKHISADLWRKITPHEEGSWWPAWEKWLVSHSNERMLPPPMGSPENSLPILCEAPGTYVMKK